jgi:hypothetical protein
MYGMAKAGLLSWSRGMRVELKGTGVTVCTLNPPYADTALLRHEGIPKKIRAYWITGLVTPEWVAKKDEYHFEHCRLNNVEKYVEDVITVFNKAWSGFKEDFVPMNREDLESALKQAKAIVEEDLIWFVYHNGEPICFYIIFPDINQVLKHFNGRLHLINKLRFLYYKKTRTITRARAIAAGVVPKFQNTGIESGIFKHLEHSFKKKYWMTEIELSWVGDFNPKMRSL